MSAPASGFLRYPASRAAFFTRTAVFGSTRGEPRKASDTVVRDRPRIRASERSVGAGADIVGLSAEFSRERLNAIVFAAAPGGYANEFARAEFAPGQRFDQPPVWTPPQ